MTEAETHELCTTLIYALHNKQNPFTHAMLTRVELATRERRRWDEDTRARASVGCPECQGIQLPEAERHG